MTNQEKVKWKKLGGGSFRMANGRIIKSNQIFDAKQEDIPVAFRDVVVPVNPLPADRPLEVVQGAYSIKSKGPGWYDVVDSLGKVINEKSLRREDAEKLLESLT